MRGKMAAATALAALSLFVFSLQARAQIICYPTVTCDRSERVVNVSSERDCCLMEPTTTARSYMVHNDDSSACQPCIVVGFNTKNETEGDTMPHNKSLEVVFYEKDGQLHVEFFIELQHKDELLKILNGTLKFVVEQNRTHPEATCGVEGDLDNSTGTTITVSRELTELPIKIYCQVQAEAILSQREKVVELIVTEATFIDLIDNPDADERSLPIPAIVANPTAEALPPFVSFSDDCCNFSEKSQIGITNITAVLGLSAIICLEIFPNPNCTGNLNDTKKDISLVEECHETPDSFMGTILFSFNITNDTLLEGNEEFCVTLIVRSRERENVTITTSNKTITIMDDDSAVIGFEQKTITVDESAGVAVLTVAVMGAQLATNAKVKVKLFAMAGTSNESDFGDITPRELVFSGGQQEATVSIPITDDTLYEDLEMFTVKVELLDSNVNISNNSSLATISIIDNDFLTVNDAVFSNGIMTVNINAPEFGSNLHLCYQVRGKPDKYFNFVSDECTSVNAHYGGVPEVGFLTFMDSINIVAIDNQGDCHRINIGAMGCLVTIDGEAQEAPFVFEQNDIYVHSNTTHVRVSVPNCEDNALVMRVICHNHSFHNPYTRPRSKTEFIDVIKFEVARELNLNESSHGLLGQFWNIPVEVTGYEGPNDTLHFPNQTYYVVKVTHPSSPPSSPPRRFIGAMNDNSWKNESKPCIFVGFSQGGPTGEVADADDSVIEGFYEEYIITSPFGTDFEYAVFDDSVCSSS